MPSIQDLAREALAQSAGGSKNPATALPPPLQAFGKAELLRATREADSPSLRWRAAEWPRPGSTTLAAMAFHAGGDTAGRAPHVFLLEPDGNALAVAARGQLSPATESCLRSAGADDVDFSFPAEPPDIGAGHAALAVHASCTGESPGATMSVTELILLERQSASLVQILEAPLERSTFDRPSNREQTQRGTLSALPHQTGGYADLRVQGAPSLEQSYRWTGKHYAPIAK